VDKTYESINIKVRSLEKSSTVGLRGQATHERQEGMSERSIESYGKLDVIDSNDSPDGW